ncbi:uncharacterized protein EI90DRAFT_3129302 [Cantharellus anzutake]|uniref:uncharacterized protein n=1 Tax=Cantharellus anzutake TaxID=1750568 RepID=UPI001906EA84|nr:uncharacterized protein EI90DRAFT_3129302 [Cantharellus anzutake]KAF8324996.1 hypothetical protein EI90DRAFT_3129302 [Cantharellus anzutake]
MSQSPSIWVIPAEVDDSSHGSLSSRVTQLSEHLVNSTDVWVFDTSPFPSSPVRSRERQVAVEPTTCRSTYDRLTPPSPVRSYERQVPIDTYTDRPPDERSHTLLPVCPSGHQVSINPASGSSLKELEHHSLPVHPIGCQVPINQFSGSSLKESLPHSLLVRSLECQVPASPMSLTSPALDILSTCDPIYLRMVRSHNECQVSIVTDSHSPRGLSFLSKAPWPSDNSNYMTKPPYIHEVDDSKSSIRTERSRLPLTHFFNSGAPTPVRLDRTMPLRTPAQSTHNHDTLASSTQDTLSYQVPDSAATSSHGVIEFEGGVFNDPDAPMPKIRNWRRIMPARLERELVPDDGAKPTLRYRLVPLDRLGLTDMFSKISVFTRLAAATKFTTGEFVIDPRGDFSLMLAEKGWASQKEFDIVWHFLDQQLNAFEKHFNSIKRAVDPSREFDESRLGGFRLASVPHTTFTDPESVERAWSAEIRPTHESTRETLGWELNSQREPAVDEVTFIHQRQQLPIELPVPRPSINVAAAMLQRDEGTVPITDCPRESYTLLEPAGTDDSGVESET